MGFAAFSALRDVIWPSQCAGCGLWDEVLCPQCWQITHSRPRISMLEDVPGILDPVPLVSLGDYDAELRNIVLAAKHSRSFDGRRFLEAAGVTLGKTCGSILGLAEGEGPIWVVPAPPSWKRRLSGMRVTDWIARGVAQGAAQVCGVSASVVDVLALKIGSHSQAGKGGSSRRRGREGVMRARIEVPRAARILIVDDVCTTGATLREAARACGAVHAAVVVAQA